MTERRYSARDITERETTERNFRVTGVRDGNPEAPCRWRVTLMPGNEYVAVEREFDVRESRRILGIRIGYVDRRVWRMVGVYDARGYTFEVEKYLNRADTMRLHIEGRAPF